MGNRLTFGKASHMVALLHSAYLEFIQNADFAALTSPDPSHTQQTIFTSKQTAMVLQNLRLKEHT